MQLLPCLKSSFRLSLCIGCWLLSLTGLYSICTGTEIAAYRTPDVSWAPDTPPDGSPVIVNVSKQVYRLVVQTDEIIKGGTSFLVSGGRVVATNYHVIDKGKDYRLGYVSERGEIHWVGLQILAVFPQKDLALLQAEENLPGTPLPLAEGYPELASDLYAIGFPAAADLGGELGAEQVTDRNFVLPSVLKGTISRVMMGVWLTNQLQHQTPISPGYSGGPLVNNHGIVVGVSTAVNKEANGISYGVAAPDLARLLGACSLTSRTVQLPHRQTSLDTGAVFSGEAPPVGKLSPDDQALLHRGYKLLSQGDIAGARTTFEYAVKKSAAKEAYQALAKTYDPAILNGLHVIGALADTRKAEELYAMASRAEGAAPRPRVTASTGCSNSVCSMLEGNEGVPVVLCNKPS